MLKSWSLNAKLSFVLSIFVFACIVISSVGVQKVRQTNEIMDHMTNFIFKRVVLSKDLDNSTTELENLEKTLVLEDQASELQRIEAELDGREKELTSTIDDYEKIAHESETHQLEEIKKLLKEWKAINVDLRVLARQGKDKEAHALSHGPSRSVLKKIDSILGEFQKSNNNLLNDESKNADELAEKGRNILIVISAISILAGLLLAFIVLRAASRSINHVIATLDENSAQVSGAAQQIAASSEQLSQAATEQASSLEETSSSVEEMNSMVQKNAENARKSSDSSTTSHQSATRGKEVVQEMIRGIEGINESNRQFTEIVKVISEIGNKTKVINDIVFQTKILSFNASVEAARAGVHGRGFAVVADEVGKLAQMSGNAAKDISAMLEGSMQKVEGIVSETKAKVESGTQIATQCGTVLDEIVTNVSDVNQMVGEISTACQEQAQGVQEITKAINQLDQVTQENASTSEETASAAEELSAQAESLQNVVRLLMETIQGSRTHSIQGRTVHQTNGPKHSATSTISPTSAHHPGQAHPMQGSKASVRSRIEPGKVHYLKGDSFRPNKKGIPSKGNANRHPIESNNEELDGVPSENDPRFKEV